MEKRIYQVFLGCCIILFLNSVTLQAAELYTGKRWGFSMLTATPANHIAWSLDGKYLFFTIVGDNLTYIYRIKDVWRIKKGITMPGNIKADKIMEVKGKIQDFAFASSRMSAAYSVSEGAEYGGLYVANLANYQTTRITQGRGPKWSPGDKSILYYFFGKKRTFGIAQINPDGSSLQLLSELGDWGPVWSPDGNFISFLSSRGFSQGTTGFSNVFIMRLNPASTTKVTHDDNSYQKNLQWALKGKKMVFETYQGVEVIDTGNFQRKLIIPRGDCPTSHIFQPFFSPDGKWIIYRREKGMGFYNIYTFEQINLGGSVPWDSLTLSPDGKKIAFSVSVQGEKKGLWVVEAFDNW